ncbi:hypothetical protein IMZ11_30900 [Microtetraspora sp. AC03309]|uniref:hypothetical protein n=1 Tax=Microtetraspora sp. AC03309 TaxID=2779376 RepID=UPI001E57A02A|nr:hypothetical protein [Microtetraspora sp. AC03309]MCC5580042.1 hypothetical protein [Microtetraspora sp. AC03309]
MVIKDMTGCPSDPDSLIEETDWASLQHACGPADDTPSALTDLLNGPPDAQARAAKHLDHVVHHQNSLYTATAPAALYVAAILTDSPTDIAVPYGREGRRCRLRQALLDWLGSVADEVGKEAETTLVRLGFPPEGDPAFVQVRAIRPALFQGVSSLLHSPDPVIREAALAAAVRLLDAPELTHHRAVLIPMVRTFLATSSNRIYRAIAIDGLDAWGEETTSLVRQEEEPAHNQGEWGRDPWSADDFSGTAF